jgi:hypothetical protein
MTDTPRCTAIIMGWGWWSRCERPAHETGNHIDRVWHPVNRGQ